MVRFPSTTILELDSFIVAQTSGKRKVQYLVDKEDEHFIKEYSWYNCKKGYLHSSIYKKQKHTKEKQQEVFLLHRLIMNAPEGMSVDHINGNTMDNRKSNLRICTNTDNARNAKPYKNKFTKGVSFRKGHTKKIWRSRIRVNDKLIHLGDFETVVEAQRAYNEAAKIHFGEYAKLVDLNKLEEITKKLIIPTNLIY